MLSMRRATPPEQVQTVPLTRHDEGQVGCTVECGHRKGAERGLLPTPSPYILGPKRAGYDGVHGLHHCRVSDGNSFSEINP